MKDPHQLSEAEVRYNLIDPLLNKSQSELALPSYGDIVRKAFDAFIFEHHYNADQTRFLRTVQTVFIQKRKLEEADLYEPPFSNLGMNTMEKLFTGDDVMEIIYSDSFS